MSFNGVLLIGEKSFQVLSLTISCSRPTDANGKPGKEAYTVLELCINSFKGGQLFWELYETSPDATIDGEISFMPFDEAEVMKNFKFRNASCVPMEESFETKASPPMTMRLTISTKEFDYTDIDMLDFLNGLK